MLYPLDGEVPFSLPAQNAARHILYGERPVERFGRYCHGEPRSFSGRGRAGQQHCLEVGLAVALGKPVWGYRSNESTLAQRVEAAATESDGAHCAGGSLIEDFGLSVNLMLACSARVVVGGPTAA
ncbi:nucleoside 2-deoxyribosyltransferase [Caballeronia sp. GAWG1-1]|uniref:nucleoside 2-deoxyribosyltransferase n=1 Tax=Caballeronia sp. GAWG1-1 TaxID=2921742 RepID=UPI0032ECE39B